MVTPVNNQIDYSALLTALSQNDPKQRKQAEEVYNAIPVTDKFTVLGSSLCQTNIPDELRMQSAVLLRRLILSSWSDIKNAIPSQQLISSCSQLLLLLKNSVSFPRPIQNSISNVISALASNFVDEQTRLNQWSDFINFLFESFISPEPALRIIAFSIFSEDPSVLGIVGEQTAYLDQLHQCFSQNLNEKSGSNLFYTSLTGAIASLLSANSENKECLKKLSNLTPPVVSILRHINGNSDKETICQQLIEVAEESPTSFRPAIDQLMQVCVDLMGVDDEETGLRSAALELAVSLIESAPGMIKKRAFNYIKPVILRTLSFMTEIEDDPEWHTSEFGERDDDDPDVIGETSLDRISTSLGGKIILPILVPELTLMLQRSDWQSRHAALMAFSTAGEGCRDQLQNMLDQVVDGVLVFLKDAHPRVRYAACNTIGQMSTDFEPDFQEKFHAKAVPALLELIVDFAYLRVQAHAAAALVNFIEDCPAEILQPYVKPLAERLHAVLTKYFEFGLPKEESHKFIIEQMIVTLAALADTSLEAFKPFYTQFINILKVIIQQTSDKEDFRLMRGKAIECVSLIGIAVGKEQFMADASDIMQLLLATQTGQIKLDDDDPQLSYIMAAWARICRVLGPDFQSYLPYVMEPVLQAAGLKIEIALLSDDDKAAIENGSSSWECLELNDQSVGIKTAGLEDKATACQMLVCYARELKHAFVDWVEKTAEVLIPLLKFPLHDDVRLYAAECMPYLIESSKPKGFQAMGVLWDAIYTNLIPAIKAEADSGVLVTMLQSLGNCIENLGPTSMDNQKMMEVTEVLQGVFDEYFNELKKEYEDCKDEDYEAASVCSADEEDNVWGIYQVVFSLLTVYKAQYLPYFELIIKRINELSSKDPHIPLSNYPSVVNLLSLQGERLNEILNKI